MSNLNFVDSVDMELTECHTPANRLRRIVKIGAPKGHHTATIRCQGTRNHNSLSNALQLQEIIFKQEKYTDDVIPESLNIVSTVI